MQRRMREGSAVTRGEMLTWGPTNEVTTLLWYDAGREAVAELLDSLDSATTTSFHAGDTGTFVFVHQREYEFADAVMDLVARSRVAFVPPITFHDSGDVTFEAVGDATYVSEFYDDLNELGDAKIEHVHEFSRGQSARRLTDRQRAALEAAVAVGYYDVPRSGSLDAVAAELDCAVSTAGELVRKAEAAVVRGFVGRG